MALFRKLFYRKPPDGLLEISERVYVFDYCFTTDVWEEQNYKSYVGGIMGGLKEHYPDALILLFNFREENTQSMIANALGEYDMTIMDYPKHYEGVPLLPMEVIHHFLRSGESWLSLGSQNVLLMHCERGGWPVLAFMLAALLIYRKQYSGELKTLEMVYRQAPRELLHLLSPLNPMPSQLRYLQYISRRNVASEWPPLDRALTIECIIIRMIPDFDGAGGCRPIFRIYGQDPFLVSDRAPKVLFSTPRKSRTVRHYKQAECELVKIDINCHTQGDVVLECICLHDDMEREEMMFRVMFNTAFIRSNILMLNRDEIDLLWDAKDRFPKTFRAEVLFSEMDAATSVVPQDLPFFDEKDGLPVEAFARVQEIFSSVDWGASPKIGSAVEVNQHIGVPLNTVVEAYSDAEKLQRIQTVAALEYIKSSMDLSPQSNRSSPQSISTTPKKDTESDPPGQPLGTSLSPVTSSLQDKVGVHQGSFLPQISPEVLRSSTLTLNNDIAVRHSVSVQSAQSHVSCDVAVREGCSKSELAPAGPSSSEGAAEGALMTPSAAEIPASSDIVTGNEPKKTALPPSAPSSTEGVVSGAGVAQSTVGSDNVVGGGPLKPAVPPSAPSSTVGIVKGSISPHPPPTLPPSRHYSSTENVENSTKDGHLPPIGSSLSVRDDTQPSEGRLVQTPHPPNVSSSTADATYKSGLPIRPPPPPATSFLKEKLNDKDRSPTPSPLSSTQPSPHPPPPPPPPPPLSPVSMDRKVSRPPPPPPPPSTTVQSPTENTSIRLAPPPPPPPLRSGHGDGFVNQSPVLPPPPPPAPAGPPRSSMNSPAVPSAPPPPLPSRKEDANSSNPKGSSMSVAPSPPPPSAPPGGKGKSLTSRAVTSRSNPNKKLKPLHWLKITRAVSGSLWAETQKAGEASKAPEIDMSELESLFSTAPSNDQGVSGRKAGSRASMMPKPEKVQLIDHRRAYNCEIMLSKVKIPLHELLTSVLALEDTALEIDQVENVIRFCPTKEEMELLKGYKGEIEKLGKCEQFFLELMQVPRVESKLRVFSFKIQFSSQVSDLRNNLNIANSAADQIRGSAKLKRIMQTILSLGNALNQGTARGSAVGFKLDSLLKLTETRAMNNKMTLMHYLCKVLADKLPELLDFWEDLSSLERASKIQLKYLAEEMQAINKGLEKIVQELSMSENDGPVSDEFRKALKEFLCFSESEVRSLASLYSGVGRNVDALILYFGEDPARCPFEQVISTLLNFVRMFKRAHEENCKQLELDKKKAEKEASGEKEASTEKKINASDAGSLLKSSVGSVK